MKLPNAILASAACLSLGACVFSIDTDDYDHGTRASGDAVTITLPSGDKSHFSCPDELDIFVVDATSQGKGLIYGCRSRDVAVPVVE